jgi:putative oxidoreductase
MTSSATAASNARTGGRLAETLSSVGLLLLRVGFGAQLAGLHGWSKLSSFAKMKDSFPDPIGLGHTLSLTLVTGAEFFCAILIALGLFTRLAAIPLIVNMAVAGLIFHADDPWSKKELAFVYLLPFVTLLLTGGGRFSFDALIFKRRGVETTSVQPSSA